jgi:hypothetical protein
MDMGVHQPRQESSTPEILEDRIARYFAGRNYGMDSLSIHENCSRPNSLRRHHPA